MPLFLDFFDVVFKMMDEKTPIGSLPFVVALLIFVYIIFNIGPIDNDKLDFLVKIVKIILIPITILGIANIVFNFFKNEKPITPPVNVTRSEFSGLYRGKIYPLKSYYPKDTNIYVEFDDCLLHIETNLKCTLYSENDTIKQVLGNIFTTNDPVSSVLLPKLGWATCKKNGKGNAIELQSDSLKNNNYHFKFSKNENR